MQRQAIEPHTHEERVTIHISKRAKWRERILRTLVTQQVFSEGAYSCERISRVMASYPLRPV